MQKRQTQGQHPPLTERQHKKRKMRQSQQRHCVVVVWVVERETGKVCVKTFRKKSTKIVQADGEKEISTCDIGMSLVENRKTRAGGACRSQCVYYCRT
jgi:hypothetical protein